MAERNNKPSYPRANTAFAPTIRRFIDWLFLFVLAAIAFAWAGYDLPAQLAAEFGSSDRSEGRSRLLGWIVLMYVHIGWIPLILVVANMRFAIFSPEGSNEPEGLERKP